MSAYFTVTTGVRETVGKTRKDSGRVATDVSRNVKRLLLTYLLTYLLTHSMVQDII
jgi:hypothetical protein